MASEKVKKNEFIVVEGIQSLKEPFFIKETKQFIEKGKKEILPSNIAWKYKNLGAFKPVFLFPKEKLNEVKEKIQPTRKASQEELNLFRGKFKQKIENNKEETEEKEKEDNKEKNNENNKEVIQEESKKYKCPFCNKEYKNPKSLYAHKKNKHFDQANYKCEICNKYFFNEKRYKKHIKDNHSKEQG